MKLYLSVGKQCPQGYLQVDPSPKGNNVNFCGEFSEDYALCGYGECEHIIVDNIYDLLKHEDKPRVVQHWFNLLAQGGRITITGKDFIEVSKGFLVGDFDVNKLNGFLSLVKSVDELDNVAATLKSVGFKVENQKLDFNDYMIECVK
jgi:hypothetical protein